MNDNGLIVGASTTAGGQSHCVAWTSPTTIVDLGTLGGSSCSAQAVSSSGQIVGNFTAADGTYHAFSGTVSGGLQDIGGLGGTYATATAVNGSGQVVGYGLTPSGVAHAFSWTAAGGMVDLHALVGSGSTYDHSLAYGVNSSGQIAGQAYSTTGDAHGNTLSIPVLWQNVGGSSAPAFTSAASDNETFGVPFSFTVTTSGSPAAKLTKSGALPSGVTFTDNGDGTATIAGTPANGAIGVYPITLTAKNKTGTATQSFSLAISKAPKLLRIPTTTAPVGTALTIGISAKAYTTASISQTGSLPAGLAFIDNADGTATISGTPAAGSGGSYPITITATNPTGTASQTFTLKVTQPPAITSPTSASAGRRRALHLPGDGHRLPRT